MRKTSGSETSLRSEKGWEAAERPPAIARSEPDQQIPIFQHMKTMPEFLTAPLAAEGQHFLRTDASTGGAHFESWAAKPMCSGPEAESSATLEHLFLSSEGNFDTLYRGPKNAKGGISPLPPLPERPGVEPSGPPLSDLETSTKGTAPWRLKKVGPQTPGPEGSGVRPPQTSRSTPFLHSATRGG